MSVLVVLVQVAIRTTMIYSEDHNDHGSADDDRFLPPVAVS